MRKGSGTKKTKTVKGSRYNHTPTLVSFSEVHVVDPHVFDKHAGILLKDKTRESESERRLKSQRTKPIIMYFLTGTRRCAIISTLLPSWQVSALDPLENQRAIPAFPKPASLSSPSYTRPTICLQRYASPRAPICVETCSVVFCGSRPQHSQ